MTFLSQPDAINQVIKTRRPEIELLLCCARLQVDDANTKQIKALVKENIDWQNLIQTAYLHGLMPLLYTHLNTICPYAIPEAAFNELRNLFYANTQRNLLLSAELVKILRLLQENGITALPYKGPILATSLYGNIALRQFNDLDIVVQQPDILNVKKALVNEGYRPRIEFTEAEEIAYLNSKSEHTYDFINDVRKILIEIHWRITPKYTSPIEPKHFWDNLEPFSFSSITVSNLPLEDWLLILCVHGSRHRWEKLSWPCDIAQLIRVHPEINWESVIQKASEFDCKRMLFLGICLAHKLIGVILPTKVLQQIQADSVVTSLASEIYKELLSEVASSHRFMTRTLYHIKVRERWQNKFLYFESFLRWLINPEKAVDEHN